MAIRIYHNPRCSKSRATLAILEEKGIEPEVVDYQVNPPSAGEIARLSQLLGIEPAGLVRPNDAKKAGIEAELATADAAQVAILLSAHPAVIERPIVVKDDARAVIGRPPENVLTLL